jgi:hypothetical protein
MLANMAPLYNAAGLSSPLLWAKEGRRRLRKRIGVLLATVMMLAVMGASPAFAVPDKNDPPSHSCGLNDPNAYKDGGRFDEGEPGAGELGKVPENHPLAFGCAPGK